MRVALATALCALAGAAWSAEFKVELEVPRLSVAEYHAPTWPSGSATTNPAR